MTVAAPRSGATTLPSWLAATAVGTVTLAIALATVSPYLIGAFHDDAIYVILGRALATGAGYRYLNLPAVPHATHYPPGYPALLAALWRLNPHFPANVALFQIANAALLGCSAVLTYVLVRSRLRLSGWWAAVVAWGGTATIPPLALAGMILSETLCLAVLLAALIAAEGVAQAGVGGVGGVGGESGGAEPGSEAGGDWRALRAAAIAGALCGGVALVRTVGFVVIPAAVGACLWRRRPRSALVLGAAAMLVLLPWQLWVWRHGAELAPVLQGEYGSYAGWLTGALRRHGLGFALATAGHNIADITTTLGVQMAPRLPSLVKGLAVVCCGGLAAAGAPRLVRIAPVTAGFVVLYGAEVVFWPFPSFRFLWAAWVFIVLVLAMGAVSVWEWQPRGPDARRARWIAIGAAALVGIAVLRYNVLGYRGHWWNTMQTSLSARESRPLGWLASHPTLPGVVVSDEEPALYLYAGLTGVPCNSFTPDEYVYPRDTARDRAVLDVVLHRFPVGAVVATGPACALAALRLSQARPAALVPLDTLKAGLAVFARAHP